MAGFDGTIMFADNVDFSGSNTPAAQITTNGQFLIGSTAAPHIRPGTLTSTGGTVTITYSSPNVNLETTGGQATTKFDVQANTAPGTDPVVPTALGVVVVNGAAVANHSVVLETRSRAANAYNLEIQYSASAAATDATKSGVAHFDSAAFTVDANGFVQLLGTGAITKVNLQTGTSPIVPTGGAITLNGAVVAAGTNPVRTDGTGANTGAIEVQISQALAATDATKIGLSNFNSTYFSVDANGFVSLVKGPFTWSDTSGTVTAVANNGYFITAVTTSTLPAAPAEGDTVRYIVDTASALTITAAGSQKIRVGNTLSAAGGTTVNSAQGDAIELVYRTTGTTWFAANNPVGAWTTT